LGGAPLLGPSRGLFFLSSSKRAQHTSSCSIEALTSSFRVQPQNSVKCSHSTGLNLLLIGVGGVGTILREVVELLAVLIHTARTLLQVQELLKLASHQACGDVVPTKSCAELGPRHLVAVLNSGGEVSPPSTRGSTKLLGCE
jgi:hypothetical protein